VRGLPANHKLPAAVCPWSRPVVECHHAVTLTWNSRSFGALATGIRNFSSHLGWKVRSAIEVYLQPGAAAVSSSGLHTSST
jgi:hypothetical protein